MENTASNLLDYFGNIPDPRRLQGQRHDLKLILLLTLMSIMSGYIGYRPIGDFIRRNRKELLVTLQPKKGRLPSFDVVRQVLMHIDFTALAQQFYLWARKHIDIKEHEWISMDGKAIGGTLSRGLPIDQDFVSLVSAYCTKKKLVLANKQLCNSKQSEIPVVQQLIETLDLQGVTFSLDALHCQKKL